MRGWNPPLERRSGAYWWEDVKIPAILLTSDQFGTVSPQNYVTIIDH